MSKHTKAVKVAKPAAPDMANQLDLKPGQSIDLLKALHILTRDGKLNQDSRRKPKQVYHLYQLIEPLLQELGKDGHAVTLADHGAGKSYLGFILYDLYFKPQGLGHIYGIETRAPLVEELYRFRDRLPEKLRYLADAPQQDPEGNKTMVRFSRKTKQQYVSSEKDGKATGWSAFYVDGKWVEGKK